MTTLRKDLERKMERANDAIRVYDWVQENYPELLDLEVDATWAYSWGYLEFVSYQNSNGLAGKVASILGVEESFEKIVSNGYEKTQHRIPAEEFRYGYMHIETKVRRKGCKRYRVVKEYETEVCGDPPSGDGILEVEELS